MKWLTNATVPFQSKLIASFLLNESDFLSRLKPDVDECLEDNGGCASVCENSEGSFRCECEAGFDVQEDGSCMGNVHCDVIANRMLTYVSFIRFFYEMNVDVDECAIDDAAVCDQICRNIDGSFECACNSGYVLNEDGLTCSGMTMH